MAKLNSFVYCLHADRKSEANGFCDTINAMGVVSTIVPESVPGNFSFSIVFSVLDINLNINNTIRVIFRKDEDKSVLSDTGDVELPSLDDNNTIKVPAEFRGLNMCLDFRNLIFETSGVYSTEIIVNNKSLGKVPLYVVGNR